VPPRKFIARDLLVGLLVLLLVFSEPLYLDRFATAQERNDLRITLVEGNNKLIRKNSALQLVVEIRDALKAPVRGAEVTFIAPEFGPGALFAGNLNRLTVLTNAEGRATTGPTRSVGGNGPFTITILAMAQGNTATAAVPATNQTSGDSSSSVKKKSRKIMWFLIAGGGAAAGVFLATKKSTPGSETPSSESGGAGGGTITAGVPTVGAPQ
jgi:hypothetical protein